MSYDYFKNMTIKEIKDGSINNGLFLYDLSFKTSNLISKKNQHYILTLNENGVLNELKNNKLDTNFIIKDKALYDRKEKIILKKLNSEVKK